MYISTCHFVQYAVLNYQLYVQPYQLVCYLTELLEGEDLCRYKEEPFIAIINFPILPSECEELCYWVKPLQ